MFGADLIQANDERTWYCSGFPTFALFQAVFKYLEGKALCWTSWSGENTASPDDFASRQSAQPGISVQLIYLFFFFSFLLVSVLVYIPLTLLSVWAS